MRKTLFALLLCLSLVLAQGVSAEGVQPDVDLTDLDPADAVEALYDLAEDNRGRVVRLRGYISYIDWDDAPLFLLTSDVASCCAAQVEFIPAAVPKPLEPEQFSDQLFTVQGVLDVYDNDGYDDVRLIEAQIEREAL